MVLHLSKISLRIWGTLFLHRKSIDSILPDSPDSPQHLGQLRHRSKPSETSIFVGWNLPCTCVRGTQGFGWLRAVNEWDMYAHTKSPNILAAGRVWKKSWKFVNLLLLDRCTKHHQPSNVLYGNSRAIHLSGFLFPFVSSW